MTTAESTKHHVLVADDEESLRMILTEALESEDFLVTTASDGLEALALAKAQRFDVLLTDIRMPRMTGLDLLRELEAVDPRIEVVIMTSQATLETSMEAIRLGAYDYVLKPFEDLRVVAQVVRRAAEQFQLVRRNEELLRRLAEASEQKSRFLASMSHELRTPMNSIIGYSDLILNKSEALEPKHRKNLEKVLSNAQHLLSLINEILDLSKIEAGKMELRVQEIELSPLFESALTMTLPLLKGKRVQLVHEIEPGLPRIHTDGLKLKQVLINLLSNACKFTKQGQVTLSASMSGRNAGASCLRIDIADSGAGIPEREMELLFQEFRQLQNAATGELAGTGLGLALVKKFVELMGGTIEVRSQVDVGSTFTVLLPLRELERRR